MNEIFTEKCTSLPKISIGIVVYNGIKYIRDVLKSVIGQSYKNIELIVVDGNSMDGTQDALKEYAEHISALVIEPDKGIYDAMNKVCSRATGDWLLFLGCDDQLLSTFDRIVPLLSEPDSVYYGDVIKRSSGKIYGGKFSKFKLMQHNICHQAVFYPKSVYKIHSYSMEYQWLADYVYNLKLMGDKVPFVYTGVVISIYNDEGGSASGDADLSRDHLKLIRESFGNTYALIEFLRRILHRQKVIFADIIARALGVVFKFLLPYSVWKYCQSLWRNIRKSFYK